MDCTSEQKKLIPLSKVVSASIVDSYEDIGKTEQVFSHWAARGLKKLQSESLPQTTKKVLITINANTHTGTLPLDFDEETFVGIIDNRGFKIPMKLNNNIPDSKNVETIECTDKCEKCAQDKNICNDLAVSETTNLIVIGSNTYEQVITKKLYPNGDYYLETSTPVQNIEDSNTVDYAVTKEFITAFDLKPCGCLETTATNIATLQCFCPDVYCQYYAPCGDCTTKYGGYRIYPESGLIQFDANFRYSQVYIEYKGFIPKFRGQYYVPQVAFETLVEWIKFKSVQNRKSITPFEKNWYLQNYIRERRNMERVIGRFSIAQFIQAATIVPKFDLDYNWYSCFTTPSSLATSTTAAASGAASSSTGTGAGSTTTIINNNTTINRGGFTLAVKVDGGTGHPVSGLTTYQNNVLKNATDINYIIVAKTIETIPDGDFTFDPATGTIDRSPNIWQTGDVLIVNYNKDT